MEPIKPPEIVQNKKLSTGIKVLIAIGAILTVLLIAVLIYVLLLDWTEEKPAQTQSTTSSQPTVQGDSPVAQTDTPKIGSNENTAVPPEPVKTYPIVARPGGDIHPITSNNILWQQDQKTAVDNNDNCIYFVWQYMYDVYGLSTPNDFYYAWPIEEMNAKFPKQARSTPAVGEIVYFEPKSQIYSLQNGRVITVSNTGHMAVVTGANEDGTVNMIDSGSGRGWGNAHTFDPKRSTRFSYYDFR